MTRWIPLLSLTIASASVWADTVELSGGGHLAGKVVRQRDHVIVSLDDELQLAVPASRVRRVVESEQLAEYRRNVQQAGDDAELHYRLAIWCVTGSNVPGDSQVYKRRHMQRAIELDPDHAQARASLGYIKHQGGWILHDELMRRRGMISRAGRWELPEAVALGELQQSTNVDAKKWIQEVDRHVKNVLPANAGRNAKRAEESWAALQAIEDPLAADAIKRQLEESRRGGQSREMRMLWVRLLGKFRNSTSVEALVRTGIDEKDATIREAALDELVQYGGSSAVATYLPMLKASNNALVNRAAHALSWFPDPELALTYVDALVTTHTSQAAPGPEMNVGFGDNGGGGMSMGGKPKVVKREINNPAVLSLLKQIEPNADFGYDQNQWREYFASQRTQYSGDLRRDP